IDIDERARLVKDLGDNPVMILRNHGLLAVGKSIPLAFSNLFNLQFACETQVLAMAGNTALTLPGPPVSEHTAKLAVAPDAPRLTWHAAPASSPESGGPCGTAALVDPVRSQVRRFSRCS